MLPGYQWDVHFVPDFANNGSRLIALARRDGGTSVLTHFDEDTGVAYFNKIEEGTSVDTAALPLIPQDLLVAIGEAIKPGPSQQVVEFLQEALDYERKRVNSFMAGKMNANGMLALGEVDFSK